MNLIYVGSSNPEEVTHKLLKMGSNVNFASKTLQNALLEGLFAHNPNLKIISSWGISPFPKVKKIFFNREELSYGGKTGNYIYVGALNLPIINLLSRFIRIRRELKRQLSRTEENSVIIYEVHTPYLLAVATLRKHIKKTCLIVPDLPEFMSGNNGSLHKILKRIDKFIISKCLSKIDSYALLSEPMQERLPMDDKQWTLMEGIFQPLEYEEQVEKETLRTIMYTGGVFHRRGVDLLLDAFEQIDKSNYRLWIRGNGDMVPEIKERAKKDPRIIYFEPMSREELLKMERRATVMINPTPPSLDFTRYFFPSKTMEYLASGTPTIMYRLGCMPKEYDEHVYYVDDERIEALRDKLVEICEKPQEELDAFGKSARNFILSKKSPFVQCGKILELLNKL